MGNLPARQAHAGMGGEGGTQERTPSPLTDEPCYTGDCVAVVAATELALVDVEAE